MNEEPGGFEADELLRMIGRAPAPAPGVLEEAREILWSAVAREMLGAGVPGEQAGATGKPAGRQEHRRSTRRPRTGQPDGERGMSMGGGEDQER